MNEAGEQPRHYDLARLYGNESPLQRYLRLTVGADAGAGALLVHELALGLGSALPGALGLWLRARLYPRVFRGISRRAFIGRQVTLRCPRHMLLADGVLIEDYAQLVAASQRQPAIRIGAGSFVRSFASIHAGPPEGFVHIGAGSGVGQGTVLYGNGGLAIGDDVLIAGQCFIVASSHAHARRDLPMSRQGFTARGITIANNVWIGAGAKILDGVTIGEGAIVGANAVVTRDVAPWTRVAGIPARPLAPDAEAQA